MTTKQRVVLAAISATMFLVSVILAKRNTAKIEQRNDQMEKDLQDIRRRNKELEALESHLADKVETGKFWLQVTEEE